MIENNDIRYFFVQKSAGLRPAPHYGVGASIAARAGKSLGAKPPDPHLGYIKESGAEVAVGVRSRAVGAEVEKAIARDGGKVPADAQRIRPGVRVHVVCDKL